MKVALEILIIAVAVLIIALSFTRFAKNFVGTFADKTKRETPKTLQEMNYSLIFPARGQPLPFKPDNQTGDYYSYIIYNSPVNSTQVPVYTHFPVDKWEILSVEKKGDYYTYIVRIYVKPEDLPLGKYTWVGSGDAQTYVMVVEGDPDEVLRIINETIQEETTQNETTNETFTIKQNYTEPQAIRIKYYDAQTGEFLANYSLITPFALPFDKLTTYTPSRVLVEISLPIDNETFPYSPTSYSCWAGWDEELFYHYRRVFYYDQTGDFITDMNTTYEVVDDTLIVRFRMSDMFTYYSVPGVDLNNSDINGVSLILEYYAKPKPSPNIPAIQDLRSAYFYEPDMDYYLTTDYVSIWVSVPLLLKPYLAYINEDSILSMMVPLRDEYDYRIYLRDVVAEVNGVQLTADQIIDDIETDPDVSLGNWIIFYPSEKYIYIDDYQSWFVGKIIWNTTKLGQYADENGLVRIRLNFSNAMAPCLKGMKVDPNLYVTNEIMLHASLPAYNGTAPGNVEVKYYDVNTDTFLINYNSSDPLNNDFVTLNGLTTDDVRVEINIPAMFRDPITGVPEEFDVVAQGGFLKTVNTTNGYYIVFNMSEVTGYAGLTGYDLNGIGVVARYKPNDLSMDTPLARFVKSLPFGYDVLNDTAVATLPLLVKPYMVYLSSDHVLSFFVPAKASDWSFPLSNITVFVNGNPVSGDQAIALFEPLIPGVAFDNSSINISAGAGWVVGRIVFSTNIFEYIVPSNTATIYLEVRVDGNVYTSNEVVFQVVYPELNTSDVLYGTVTDPVSVNGRVNQPYGQSVALINFRPFEFVLLPDSYIYIGYPQCSGNCLYVPYAIKFEPLIYDSKNVRVETIYADNGIVKYNLSTYYIRGVGWMDDYPDLFYLSLEPVALLIDNRSTTEDDWFFTILHVIDKLDVLVEFYGYRKNRIFNMTISLELPTYAYVYDANTYEYVPMKIGNNTMTLFKKNVTLVAITYPNVTIEKVELYDKNTDSLIGEYNINNFLTDPVLQSRLSSYNNEEILVRVTIRDFSYGAVDIPPYYDVRFGHKRLSMYDFGYLEGVAELFARLGSDVYADPSVRVVYQNLSHVIIEFPLNVTTKDFNYRNLLSLFGGFATFDSNHYTVHSISLSGNLLYLENIDSNGTSYVGMLSQNATIDFLGDDEPINFKDVYVYVNGVRVPIYMVTYPDVVQIPPDFQKAYYKYGAVMTARIDNPCDTGKCSIHTGEHYDQFITFKINWDIGALKDLAGGSNVFNVQLDFSDAIKYRKQNYISNIVTFDVSSVTKPPLTYVLKYKDIYRTYIGTIFTGERIASYSGDKYVIESFLMYPNTIRSSTSNSVYSPSDYTTYITHSLKVARNGVIIFPATRTYTVTVSGNYEETWKDMGFVAIYPGSLTTWRFNGIRMRVQGPYSPVEVNTEAIGVTSTYNAYVLVGKGSQGTLAEGKFFVVFFDHSGGTRRYMYYNDTVWLTPISVASDGNKVFITLPYNHLLIISGDTGDILYYKKVLGAGELELREVGDEVFVFSESGNVLIKLNSNDLIEWSYSYSGISEIVDIDKSDDGYIVLGRGTNGNDVVLMEISSTGSVLWAKRYTFTNFTSVTPFDAFEIPGGIIFTFRADNMYIVRTDKNGNIYATQTDTPVTVENVGIVGSAISLTVQEPSVGITKEESSTTIKSYSFVITV